MRKKYTVDEIFEIENNLRLSIDKRFFAEDDSERGEYEDTEYDTLTYNAFAALQDLRHHLDKSN